MSLDVAAIHHVTIGCTPAELPALVHFYRDILGLEEGHRPPLRHPGYWLYAGGHAIVHLNALLQTPLPRHGGAVDHVALTARGLVASREALREAGVAFEESPLTGTTLQQVFVRDPLGLRVELNFDLVREREGDAASG